MGPTKSANKWATTAHTTSAFYDSTVTSYAYCSKGKKPKIAEATKTAKPGSGKATTVEVTCQRGKTLLGGGFSSDADPALDQGTSPRCSGARTRPRPGRSPSSTKATRRSNHRPGGLREGQIAEGGRGQGDPEGVRGPPGAVATCPKGKEVLFSGMDAEWDNAKFVAALPTGLYRSKDDAVSAVGVFGGGGSGTSNDSAELRAFATAADLTDCEAPGSASSRPTAALGRIGHLFLDPAARRAGID